MRIEKGIVKDQGFPDYELTYGIMDDGAQYYFINDGMLENGNIIASVVLKEAIGHAENTKVGLINKDGDVLISFDNKFIKVIDNKYLLVERTIPVDQNVIDANRVKSDPLAATKLVTNAANIKEKIFSSLKVNGKFLFNDQFSEASLFDLNGNSITGGEFFSFIGIDEEGFIFSKNTVDTELVNYRFDNEEDKDIDLGVLNDNVNLDLDIDSEVSNDLDVTNMELDNNTIDESVNEASLEETGTFDLGLIQENNNDMHIELDEEVNEDVNSNNSVDFDIYSGVVKDSIIEDVGSTMKRLIEANKSQRISIVNKEEEITSLRDDNRELHDLCTKQTRELSSFKDKIIKFENIISKLEGRNQMISAQLEDVEKEKNYLDEQLSILKPQVAGKETLVTLLDEANETLNDLN